MNRPVDRSRRFDPSRVLFYAVVACVLVGGAFMLGLHAGAEKNAV